MSHEIARHILAAKSKFAARPQSRADITNAVRTAMGPDVTQNSVNDTLNTLCHEGRLRLTADGLYTMYSGAGRVLAMPWRTLPNAMFGIERLRDGSPA